MTQLEKVQDELIDLLKIQLTDIEIMSKIELGDDVIRKICELNNQISILKQSYEK
jgi:hypothetical protein